MNKNNWTYCSINLYKHEQDIGGYDKVKELINRSSLLAMCGNFDSQFICFRTYEINEETNETTDEVKLIPFIFKYDKENKIFVDYFTSERYSYHTYDDEPNKRKFYEDKGSIGEYIEEANPIKIKVTKEDASRIIDSMTRFDKENYRKAQRELEKIILEGYTQVYSAKRQEERSRTRKK